MMNEQEIGELIQKYTKGLCSDAEKGLLETWYAGWNKDLPLGISGESLKDDLLINRQNTLSKIQMPSKTQKLWFRIGIAAAMLFVLGAGLYFYNTHYSGFVIQNLAQNLKANDVAPGKTGATLTLASGKKIRLSDAANGEIAKEAGIRVTKTEDGQLVYKMVAEVAQPRRDGLSGTTKQSFNVLSTARGETYQVILPDQTKVWLNAASSLRYPSAFSGNDRRVELSGEAYFEVSHNKSKPFRVRSNSQQVEVLGTHFNINSYTDEPDIKTTLLEGSVAISSLQGGTTKQSLILKPGEQASLTKSGKISAVPANVDDVIAWTNGKFIFDRESIEDIMRKLSRWYDVEVIYEGDVRNKEFAGTISRKDNISKILDKITFTQAAHFKIEGRRITVMP